MTYTELSGNLFTSNAHALVNTVNCEGFMGKGIALEFRRRFPEMFAQYQQDCIVGKYRPGFNYKFNANGVLIINCAVKDKWRSPSKVEWLESCLNGLKEFIDRENIPSISLPWMAAQNGRIPIDTVQRLTREALGSFSACDVRVYSFDPTAQDPLFIRLNEILSTKTWLTMLVTGGLDPTAAQAAAAAVLNGRVRGMSEFATKKIISSKKIDYLYKLLSQPADANTIPTQLGLFDE